MYHLAVLYDATSTNTCLQLEAKQVDFTVFFYIFYYKYCISIAFFNSVLCCSETYFNSYKNRLEKQTSHNANFYVKQQEVTSIMIKYVYTCDSVSDTRNAENIIGLAKSNFFVLNHAVQWNLIFTKNQNVTLADKQNVVKLELIFFLKIPVSVPSLTSLIRSS